MKKYLLAAASLFALFIFVGCINGYEAYEGSQLSNTTAAATSPAADYGQVTEPVLPPHVNQSFIDDFAYMVAVLENNFPYFGVAQRRFGADVEFLVENTLNALLQQEIRNTTHFGQILATSFFGPLNHIGHLSIQSRSTLHLILGNIYRGPIDYNGRPIELYGRDFTSWGQMFVDMARSLAAQQYYGFIEVELGYEAGMVRPNNLTTSTIGRNIAYVSVREFWHYNISHDLDIMMNFYEDIRGFEHLIIDLRGNPGGFTRYFIELFMAPNIPYDIVIPGIYTLFMGGDESMEWLGAQFEDDYYFAGIHPNKMPFDASRFPYINQHDALSFRYILASPVHVAATGDVMFDGQIWILVDGRSASAVEYAALYAMNADFATVVGAPTRGVTGGGHAGFFPLPNTGLVVRYDFGYFIDSYGRAIDEFGVIPHYLNLPGMDALHTVLTLIER